MGLAPARANLQSENVTGSWDQAASCGWKSSAAYPVARLNFPEVFIAPAAAANERAHSSIAPQAVVLKDTAVPDPQFTGNA